MRPIREDNPLEKGVASHGYAIRQLQRRPAPDVGGISVGMLRLAYNPVNPSIVTNDEAVTFPFITEETYFRTNDASTFEWLLFQDAPPPDAKTLAIKRDGFYRLFAHVGTSMGADVIDGEWGIGIESYNDTDHIIGAGNGLDAFTLEHWWPFFATAGVGPNRSAWRSPTDELDFDWISRMPSLTTDVSFIANEEREPDDGSYPLYPVPFSVTINRIGGTTGDTNIVASLLAIRYCDTGFSLEGS